MFIRLPMCFSESRLRLPDDVTRTDVQNALQVQVDIVKSSGQDFVQAVLGPVKENDASYEGYELKEIIYE